MSGLEEHVCARCLVPLDQYVPDVDRPDEWEWIHPAGVVAEASWADHVPVPVPAEGVLELRDRCDFCSDRDPTWRYPCESFQSPRADFASEGDWAACWRCAVLIEAGDLAGLTARCVATNPGARSLPADSVAAFSVALRTLYDDFAAHRTGERRQIR
jgi:hypothetical protein